MIERVHYVEGVVSLRGYWSLKGKNEVGKEKVR